MRVAGTAREQPQEWVTLAMQEQLPPYPGNLLINPARVLSPPVLTESMPLQERCVLMAKAYKGAVSRKRIEARWLWRIPKDIHTSSSFIDLCVTSFVLLEKKIAPAAWAMWSVDVWCEQLDERGRKRTVPPVTWVYSHTRATQHRWMFRNEQERYTTGRTIIGDKHRELVLLWCEMQRRVVAASRAGKPVTEELRSVFGCHDYATRYEALVHEARAEAAENQRIINERVERGEWCW